MQTLNPTSPLRRMFRALQFVLLPIVGLLTTTATAQVSGTKTALIMLVSLNDAPIDCSIGEVKGFYLTNLPLNVDSYFDHSTWGSVRWAGDVIAVSVNFSKSPCNDTAWSDAADQAASAQGYNPSAYTAKIYAWPSSAGNCGYAYAAGNRVGNYHCTDLFAYGHEVGHTIGMHHASTDNNNDSVIDSEYGGLDDCMGGESYTHNAPHKIWGGWLPPRAANGGWRQISADGSYQISPLELNPAGNPPFSQALKIIPPTGWPYFLSYRQPLDFDQGWTAAQVGKDGRSGTIVDPCPPISSYPHGNGVTIHRHNGAAGVQTLEIGVLADNQQFVVPGSGIVIVQNGHDANSVTLNVTGFNGGSQPAGVLFFKDTLYGGSSSQPMLAGDYTTAQLATKGVLNNWASSARIPSGFTVTMYADDNLTGTSWTLTSDNANFPGLVPNANDQMSSCRITGSANSAPGTPTGLSAIAADSQATLSWTATPGATSYNVKRATTSGGPYTTVASPTVSAHPDTGLANGTTYYYVVSAVNSFGESANSAQVSATPIAELVAHWKFDEGSGTSASDFSGNNNTGTLVNSPTWVTPGHVGAAALSFNAGSLQAVSVANSASLNSPVNGITIAAWVNAADWSGNRRLIQKGNGDNQYRLLAEFGQFKFHLSGVSQVTAALPAAGTWVHIAATWNGSTMRIYYNGVEQASASASGTIGTTADPLSLARKGAGAPSGDHFNGQLDDVRIYNRALSAAEISAIMGGGGNPPATPTGLNATAGNAQVSLNWNASSGATSYNVKRSTTSGGPYTTIASPTGTSYVDTTAVNGTTYYYVVSAVNADGESANSGQVSATPSAPSAPPTPTGLNATAGNAQVSLTWNASSGATSYNVKRSTTSGGPYTTIASPTGTSYVDTTAVNGTTYYYVVSAVNVNGESANSAQVTATPSAPSGPAAPSGLTATAGKRAVTLNWTDNSNNETGFKIERSTDGVNFSQITTVGANVITYKNTGLTSGTTYYYRVRATNGAGDSAYSNVANATAR